MRYQSRTALGLLEFLGFDDRSEILGTLSPQPIEAFVLHRAATLGRSSPQHLVSQLRCFLRFLARRGDAASGLDAWIDTPPSEGL